MIDNDRVVDTLYYGSFAKAATISGDSKHTNFIYCPGPKAVLKLIENEDNLSDLPQPLLDEKLATLSTATIAEESLTSVETVNGLLSGIRDEIVDLVLVRKQNIVLNFGFGTLNLRQGGFVDFKSNSFLSAIDVEFDKLPSDYDRLSSH
jgi:hypothetical protein